MRILVPAQQKYILGEYTWGASPALFLVAATRHGGIPEALEDGVSGILVEENDWQSLADRLGDLLEDGQKWKQAGVAARAAVESGFSQQRQIASLEEIYRELIG